MSRRRRVIHKEVKKDARYASPVVASLISTVMRAGKKSTAERIVYTAIEKTREGTDTIDPLETLNKALENVKPRLEVSSPFSETLSPSVRMFLSYRGWESNPHEHYCPRDFKSLMSTIPSPRHLLKPICQRTNIIKI